MFVFFSLFFNTLNGILFTVCFVNRSSSNGGSYWESPVFLPTSQITWEFFVYFSNVHFFSGYATRSQPEKRQTRCVCHWYIYVHNNLITAFATEQQKITLMRNVSSTYFLVCSDAISVKNLSVLVTDWTKLTF